MERTLISWNVPNWITISIMAGGTWAVLGLVSQLLKRAQNAQGAVGSY